MHGIQQRGEGKKKQGSHYFLHSFSWEPKKVCFHYSPCKSMNVETHVYVAKTNYSK